MRQSRLMSLVEALANVVVGYGVAVLVQIVMFPVFGFTVTLRQNLAIGLVFTAVCAAPQRATQPQGSVERPGGEPSRWRSMLRRPGCTTIAAIVAATGCLTC